MKLRFSVIGFVFICVSCLCKCQSRLIADSSIYPAASEVFIPGKPWTKPHYQQRIKDFKAAPLEYNDIVFLGNSITEQGGDWTKRFNIPHIKNRGISGDVTEAVLYRLEEICFYKASKVFIMIGINDVINYPAKSANDISDNIIKIATSIRKKSPGTDVYIETILPTSNSSLVAKIKDINRLLAEKANSASCTVINIHPVLADENDLIKSEYTTDGVHLTEQGYTAWVNYLKKLFNIK